LVEIATAFGLSGVGAFGFGDRGVNSDEPRMARKMRSRRRRRWSSKRGEGGRVEDQRGGKEDEEKEEK